MRQSAWSGARWFWFAGFVLTACAGDADGERAEPGEPSRGPIEPASACEDDEADLYGDPGGLPSERGAILRCVDDGLISREEVAERLASLESDTTAADGVRNTYTGPMPEGGTHRYRVLYRTERGNGAAGYAVAQIFLPEAPRAPTLPLVLLARGSRGQAPGCAPSRIEHTDEPIDTSDNADGRYVQDDFESMLWPLAGAGFAVIATDSAGYANYGAPGNPPSGYAEVQDMGKSFLDSAHALKRFAPDATSDEVAMVGLSQGGHTVLGSLSVANDYPAPGPIVAAAVYSPLWFAQRAWGIVMTEVAVQVAGVVLNESAGVPVSFWYHYTHAEMFDGPGSGVELFKPEVRDAIREFVDTTCWSERYEALADGGRSKASEFFADDLVAAVGDAALAGNCDSSPDPALCEKWMERYRDDHPVLTGDAAAVPILIAYGLKDTTIEPARFQCGVDKLEQGDNPLEFCVDPEANHSGIVLRQSAYVNEWLAHRTLGTPFAAECPETTAPKGLACDPFLPND
jgi:hypothetical protein